jgi:16S rRNA (adenine1518-N6/adenine1519-N6)-dimethyltransferase
MKVEKLLRKLKIHPRKSLGQNFLTNRNIAERIVKLSGAKKDETIIEIGVGTGVLTEEIAKHAKNVIGFEIDRNMRKLHRDLLSMDNVEIIYDDFLKQDLYNYSVDKLKYIANIPYNITSPLLEKIVFNGPKFISAVFMVQKEFAERMLARHGSKKYGSMTVKLKTFLNINREMNISKRNFYPVPNIDTVVIKLDFRKNIPIDFSNRKAFNSFVNVCFSHRRKQLKNNLKGLVEKPEEFLEKYEINPKIRAEELKIDQFVTLFKEYKRVVK